jgi:hypothetical protein
MGISIDEARHVKIHPYSGQREGITEKMSTIRRQELAATKNVSFTNCKEFLSSVRVTVIHALSSVIFGNVRHDWIDM